MEPPIDFTADVGAQREGQGAARASATPGARRRRARAVRPRLRRGRARCPGIGRRTGSRRTRRPRRTSPRKLYIDNWRWADTPFYVRTGKRLPRRETTIAIQFKRAPHPPFEIDSADSLRPNVLLIHIQPDEGVSLT